MTSISHISSSRKVATLVDEYPSLMGVLSRMGIPFGFGEQTVAQVCEAAGVDTDTFLLLANVYTADTFSPGSQALARADVRDIVKYLHASHTFYLETAIVRISNDIARLIEPCSDKLQKVIWKFFSDYKDELDRHFQFEEANVLPYVQELLSEGVDGDFCIEDFEENHSDVDAKLEDLKNLVMKALPPQCDVQLRTSLLSYLYYLRADLRRHTLIEDKVLVPVVKRIETHKARNHQHRHEEDHSDELSEREKEILVSVARGFMNKEIADMHNISINTVISHRKNITRKTGIKTVAGLTVYALLNGLIDVNSVE